MSERASDSPWIESARWDALWMFSGLWAPALAFAIYLLTHGIATADVQRSFGESVEGIALLYLPLSVLHRISTTYAVFALPGLREEIRKDRTRYLYVPAAIFAACVLLSLAFTFHTAFDFLPSYHQRLWGFFALAYVMFAWDRWHFCAQEFGVLSIYRARAQQSAPQDRRFDRFFTVVLMLGVNTVLIFCAGYPDLREVVLYGTPLSHYRGELLDPIARGAFLVGAVYIAVAVLREVRHPHGSFPKVLFYLLVGGHSIILHLYPLGLGLFFLSYAFHHWMVAIGLFGRITVGAYAVQAPRPSAWWRAPSARLVFGVAPFLVLTLFVYLSCADFDWAGNLSPVPNPRVFEGATTAAKLLIGVIVGTFFALNYLHYYYDRCFYSFRSPSIRKTVAPLLFRR
jgi:hypothetical protein